MEALLILTNSNPHPHPNAYFELKLTYLGAIRIVILLGLEHLDMQGLQVEGPVVGLQTFEEEEKGKEG